MILHRASRLRVRHETLCAYLMWDVNVGKDELSSTGATGPGGGTP